jgi:hypothetical protein
MAVFFLAAALPTFSNFQRPLERRLAVFAAIQI